MQKGFRTELNHGNVLYMSEGYWRHMRYKSLGFSMSIRSLAKNPLILSRALYNVLVMRSLDGLMRRVQGQDWVDKKNQWAITKTNSKL